MAQRAHAGHHRRPDERRQGRPDRLEHAARALAHELREVRHDAAASCSRRAVASPRRRARRTGPTAGLAPVRSRNACDVGSTRIRRAAPGELRGVAAREREQRGSHDACASRGNAIGESSQVAEGQSHEVRRFRRRKKRASPKKRGPRCSTFRSLELRTEPRAESNVTVPVKPVRPSGSPGWSPSPSGSQAARLD